MSRAPDDSQLIRDAQLANMRQELLAPVGAIVGYGEMVREAAAENGLAEIGEDLMKDFVERSHQIAELALAGEDLSDLPVYPDGGPPNPAADAFLAELFGRYSAQEAEIEAWLRERQ